MKINFYALTRYNWVRKVYGLIRSLAPSDLEIPRARASDLGQVDSYNIGDNAVEMRNESWTRVPPLNQMQISEIMKHSQIAPGRRPSYPKDETFYFSDVTNARLQSGELALMLRVDPTGCEVINSLSRDPILLGLAEAYLGYKVRSVEAQLLWSFSGAEVNLKERHKRAQAVYFHWDSMAVNGFRVNYYLTDVDEDSGAHVLIPGSHKKKPLRYLYARSTTESDDGLLSFYGKKEVIIGNAGSGFAQDVNGFHKALPPKKSNRLHLHFRFT